MLRYFCRLVLFVFLLCSFSACNNDQKAPDVSDVKIPYQSLRLDRDLASLDTNHLADGLNVLHRKYPEFLDFYFQELLGYDVHFPYTDAMPGISRSVRQFLTHPDCKGLVDTVAKHYPNTKSVDESIYKGLQYLRHYDSSYRFNKVIYLTSCLSGSGAFTYGNDIVGVGLDMFLGPQYPNYARVGIAQFLTHNMETKNITPNVFKVIYESHYPLVINDRDLLNILIQKGKEQYFLSKVIPFVSDLVRFGYTSVQMDWCRKNEAQIYNFFVQQKLLYNRDQQKIVRYVIEGPHLSGLPEQSPAHVGIYTGYKIVEEYMHKHPNTSLRDLAAINDEQMILQEAHYNPR